MFTGLVEHLGVIHHLERTSPGVRLIVRAGPLAKDAQIGDSIAVNGCCLTVVERETEELLSFEAGTETLSRTNLGRLLAGSRVNLERSLVVGDRLGGHFVSGHIDATGTLVKRRDEGAWSGFTFMAPRPLTRQMASKGSIAVDGVSLTLVQVTAETFSVALIPHTLAHTTLGGLVIGSIVNLETDLLAKYVEQQFARNIEQQLVRNIEQQVVRHPAPQSADPPAAGNAEPPDARPAERKIATRAEQKARRLEQQAARLAQQKAARLAQQKADRPSDSQSARYVEQHLVARFIDTRGGDKRSSEPPRP